VVREAGRFLNMRHQLIGGTVVHRDKIAGMRTTNIPPSRGR
jgi:preprotein translocase subunit SecA